MFTVSRALPVNPPGAVPRLTRADVWHGLELKANNALPFVPSISYCVVTERTSDTQFVREIEFRGERSHERVTLAPQERVTFDRLDGSVSGQILNEIEDADGDLALRFTYSLEIDGIPPGSAQEREYADGMEADYLQAVEATLDAARRIAADEKGGAVVGEAAEPGSDTSWVRGYYDDVDHMRMEEFLAWHTSDVTVRFGNHPPARGADEVRDSIGQFWKTIGGLRHNIVNVWGNADGTVVVEADIDYTRLDGTVVVTPCVTLLHRAGPAAPATVDQVRIFVDLAPVFASS